METDKELIRLKGDRRRISRWMGFGGVVLLASFFFGWPTVTIMTTGAELGLLIAYIIKNRNIKRREVQNG